MKVLDPGQSIKFVRIIFIKYTNVKETTEKEKNFALIAKLNLLFMKKIREALASRINNNYYRPNTLLRLVT